MARITPASFTIRPYIFEQRVRVLVPAGFTLRALPENKTTKLSTATLEAIIVLVGVYYWAATNRVRQVTEVLPGMVKVGGRTRQAIEAWGVLDRGLLGPRSVGFQGHQTHNGHRKRCRIELRLHDGAEVIGILADEGGRR